MKTKLLLLLLVVTSFLGNAQNATFSNGFETVALPTGWGTNGFTRITTQPCSGTASMTSVIPQYGNSQIQSPSYFSDGQAIRVAVTYKIEFYGILYLQYKVNTGNWIDLASVGNGTGVYTCTSLSGIIAANVVPAGSNIQFRITTYNTNSINSTFVIDDFQASQTSETVNDYSFDNTLLNKFELNSFATNSGITYINDRNGNANSAVSFGSGGMTAIMPLLPYGNSPRTVSLWVKLNTINDSGGTLMYYYGANNNGSGGTIRTTLTRHYGNAPDHTVTITNVIDTWSHYAFVYDGTISKIYKNGVLLGSESKTWNTINNLNQFQIGSPTTNNSFFNGAMDDLKIYNEALTDAQVLNLFTYNSKNIVVAPVISSVSAANVTPVAATINYSLNANNATTTTIIKYGLSSTTLTNQVSGLVASGNNLIPTSTVLPNLEPNTQYFYQIEVTNAAGTTPSAVLSFTTLVLPPAIAEYDFNNTYNNLNGSNPFSSGSITSFVLGRDGTTTSGALKIQNFTPSATITGLPYGASPRTISFWAQTNFMFNGNNSMFSYGTTGINNGNTGSFEASQITYSANSNNVVVAATTQQDVWYYFTYVYDGVNAKIYRNGVLLASEPKSWNTINNNDIFRLGIGSNNVGGFIGAFDDLKIYDYALSDNQITNLYNYNTITTPVAILPIVSNVVATPSSNEAIVSYTINANYSPTTTIIKYGTSSTNLSSQITGFSTNGNSVTNTSTISGLLQNIQYFYQIEATNSLGTVLSNIESFTTSAVQPSLAEYTFNNTLNNINGNSPFGSNAGTSFVTGRDGTTANGALNIVSTGTTAIIPNLPYGNSPRTISLWVKMNVMDAGFNFLYHYGANGSGNGFYLNANNAIHFPLSPSNHSVSVSNVINTWYHYVVIYDGTNSKIYRNGALVNSAAKTINTGVNSTANLFRLGLTESGGTGYFNGAIDDLKIYNFALSDAQVTNLFTNNSLLSSQNFNQNNLEVSLYPNPTNNVLNIEMTNDVKSIEIYNIQGQKVKVANQKQINVSDLANGMYMIKIQDTENAVSTKKFLKN